MKVYIDVDQLRHDMKEVLGERTLQNPKTEIGQSYNDGIYVASMIIDTLLLRIKSLAYQEDSADD